MGISKTDIGTTTISIIATLAVWELLTRIFHIPGFILPAPSAIFIEAVTRYPLYLYHSWITFYEMVVGFLLAAAVGVFLAVVIVYSRIIRNMIYPQIVVLQIVPKVAIAPLLLIWAGYGLTSKVRLALLVSFFPIVVNMVTGLVAIEEELLDLCRVLHCLVFVDGNEDVFLRIAWIDDLRRRLAALIEFAKLFCGQLGHD